MSNMVLRDASASKKRTYKEKRGIFGEENYLVLKKKENEGKEKWEIFGEGRTIPYL